ncbi:hypothetical protein MMC25_006052 [Agyrium rufum]|nr:hypothetical protein [Agyrium rufum]
MQILAIQSAVLPNHEVLAHITACRRRQAAQALQNAAAAAQNPPNVSNVTNTPSKVGSKDAPEDQNFSLTTKKEGKTAAILKAPNYETVMSDLHRYLTSATPASTSTHTNGEQQHSASNIDEDHSDPSSPVPLSPQPNPPSTAPSPMPDYTTPYYSADNVGKVLRSLEPYELTKGELVMVMNLRPGDMGVLDAVVEECDGRFGEGEQEGLLGIVSADGGDGEGGENGDNGDTSRMEE